jgi:hypothetical protein
MKMKTERYQGIQVRLVLPFRFLTPFFSLCFRLLRNSPRPWVKHAPRPASPGSLKPSAQKAKSSISLQPYLNPLLFSLFPPSSDQIDKIDEMDYFCYFRTNYP